MSVNKPTNAQLQYWEKRLRSYGLGMNRGRNTNKLVYGWRYDDCDLSAVAPDTQVGFGSRVDGLLVDAIRGVYDTDEDAEF